MDVKKESKSSFSLPVILLIATAIAGGVFKYYAPLDSMRPPHEDRRVERLSAEENILARMWQDPFQAVERHEKIFDNSKRKQRETGIKIGVEDIEGGLLILPVLTTVGTYSEDIEKRLRSRYALLSALHVAGYKPENESHIGVFRYNDEREESHHACNCDEKENEVKEGDGRHRLLVPYEWFILDPIGINNPNYTTLDTIGKETAKKVLVLWVGDAYFHGNMLEGLNTLLDIVETPVCAKESFINEYIINLCNQVNEKKRVKENEIDELVSMLKAKLKVKRKIIGPSSSEFLKKIYDLSRKYKWRSDENSDIELNDNISALKCALQDVKGIDNECVGKICDLLDEYLKTNKLQFYSPWATADPSILNDFDKDPFALNDLRASFVRTIHTDRQLTKELVLELERRGIDLTNKDSKDHVVLISEWDTNYGRALPLSFAMSVNKHRGKPETKPDDPHKVNWPERVHKIAYMRGIDGMLPDDGNGTDSLVLKSDSSQNKKSKSSSMGYYAPEFKQPLGQAQFDYIRRLSDRIEKLEFNQNNDGKQHSNQEIRAIGVLGSDIYDKLLILRALRGKFPNAIFFTNDLDARLFHETELPWTRNLIVASSYGLQLHPRLQKDIPPFRNVYQSSLFAATLQALGVIEQDDIDLEKVRPRIYEIGNRGPYDITPTIHNKKAVSLHPERPDLRENTSSDKLFFYIFFMVFIPLFLFGWLICYNLFIRKRNVQQEEDNVQRLRHEYDKFKKVFLGTWDFKQRLILARKERYKVFIAQKCWRRALLYMFAPTCLLAFAVFTWLAITSSWSIDGEPLTFFDGISVWPTELIRLFSGFLAIYFVVLVVQSIDSNNKEIEQFIYVTKSNEGKDNVIDRIFEHMLDVWGKHNKSEGDVGKCLRIAGYFAFAYLVAGNVFILHFGPPSIPFRGNQSESADFCILIFSLASMSFLAWFVINRIHYCRKFLREIKCSEKRSQLSNMVKTNCYVEKENNNKCDEKIECEIISEQCLNDYDENLSGYILVQWVKLQIIAKRTFAIGKMIFYPFVIFALLLIARNNYFDHWCWTKPLIIVISSTIVITLYYAFILFYEANNIRKQTISSLHEEQLKLLNIQIPSLLELNEGKIKGLGKHMKQIFTRRLSEEQKIIDDKKSKFIEQKSNYIDHIIHDLEDLKSGAFAPLRRNPIFFAILAPLGGLGTISILPHLLRLFEK